MNRVFPLIQQQRLFEVTGWLNWGITLAGIILCLTAAYIGIRLSMRVSGPLYALENQLHKIKTGELDLISAAQRR